jgi:hypothetical protein
MTNRRLETRLCFAPGTISGKDLVALTEKGQLGFEPRYVQGRDVSPTQCEISSSVLKSIGKLRAVESLFLSAEEDFLGLRSFSASLHPGKATLTLTWILPKRTEPPRSTLEALCGRPGFNAGLSFDADDVFWQSLADAQTYRALGGRIDADKLRRDPDFPDREIIDTTQNSGRLDLLPGMWMGAAWRVCFGPLAIALLGLERICAFEDCYSQETRDSGVIVVTLFRDPHSTSSPEVRATQRRFRQWLRLDEIAESTSEIGEGEGGLLIEEGRFPHGGIRRLTAHYDSKGRPTRRSSATRKETFELDSQGVLVWRSGERRIRGR